jgi:hypothetical protein
MLAVKASVDIMSSKENNGYIGLAYMLRCFLEKYGRS